MKPFFSLLIVLLLVGGFYDLIAQVKDLPESYQQIIPRGRIAALDHPQYVSADEAEIDDNTFVLGVVIEGQARAYSLNLLNNHEVVNDRIGNTNFAAVW